MKQALSHKTKTHLIHLTMKPIAKPLIQLATILLLLGCNHSKQLPKEQSVQVIIHYGPEKNDRSIVIPWEESLTALKALQHTATVTTHPVKNYIFVTQIDSTCGERGVMAWYYTINGEKPAKLAINQPVLPGDTIKWSFTKDVCSALVDN